MNYITYEQEMMVFQLAIILARIDPETMPQTFINAHRISHILSTLPDFDGKFGGNIETIKDKSKNSQ